VPDNLAAYKLYGASCLGPTSRRSRPAKLLAGLDISKSAAVQAAERSRGAAFPSQRIGHFGICLRPPTAASPATTKAGRNRLRFVRGERGNRSSTVRHSTCAQRQSATAMDHCHRFLSEGSTRAPTGWLRCFRRFPFSRRTGCGGNTARHADGIPVGDRSIGRHQTV